MQALGMNLTEFFMILSLYVLCWSCVHLIFGEDENFNARPIHKFDFSASESYFKLLKLTISICDENNYTKIFY